MKWVVNFFLDHINFCHPVLHTGEDKPESLFYNLYCKLFWPIPEKGCWCCGSVRGIMYGVLLGIVIGYLIWGGV